MSFITATEAVSGRGQSLSDMQKLSLYGLFKQAKQGDCNTKRPGFFSMTERAKWDAWNERAGMSTGDAMTEYIRTVSEMLPGWNDGTGAQSDDVEGAANGAGGKSNMGPVSSTLYTKDSQDLSDSDKSLFDWIQEGNVEAVERLLAEDADAVLNARDDQNMTALLWACDGGNEDIVELLIDADCDHSSRDLDGQTALHYAAMCDHIGVIEQLVDDEADISIKDNNGQTPADVANSEATIRALAGGLLDL